MKSFPIPWWLILPQAFRARLALNQTTSRRFFSGFGNLASLPIRRASSLVSNLAADLRLIGYLATLEGAAAMHNKKS
jgi:hypothetical protein